MRNLFVTILLLTSGWVAAQKDTQLIRNIDGIRVFLNGEQHIKPENNLINLHLLKYYHQHANVRVVFMEMGYTDCFLLNKYINTGDEELFTTVDILPFSIALYRELRAFNLSLPTDQKIVLRGVDCEIDDISFLHAMFLILGDKVAPPEIAATIGNFKKETEFERSHNSYEVNLSKKYLQVFFLGIQDNREAYRSFLGSDYNDFERIIYSQVLSAVIFKKNDKGYDRSQAREFFIFENVKRILKDNPGVNLYGQFGAAHVSLHYADKWGKRNNWYSFAARLNNEPESPAKGKVISSIVYYDTRRYPAKMYYINKDEVKRNLKEMSCGICIIPYEPKKHAAKTKYFDFIITAR